MKGLSALFFLFSGWYILLAFSGVVFSDNHFGEPAQGRAVFDVCTGDDCVTGLDGGSAAIKEQLTDTGIIESNDIVRVVLGFVKFFLTLLGVIAFIAFLWSGALYITAFGNEENAESAKKVLVWTSIGIIIILISYALVSTLIRATVTAPV